MEKKTIMFGVLALLVFAVSIASADGNVVYFNPQDSTAPDCSDTTVEVRLTASDDVVGWEADIAFNPDCINITDVDFTGSPFSDNMDWMHYGDHIRVFGACPYPDTATGDLFLADLTIHCISSECVYCESPLEFTNVGLYDNMGADISVTVTDSTFTCGTSGENVAYFNPQDSTAPDCSDTTVEVRLTASDDVVGWEADIAFNPDCINITDVDFTGSPFSDNMDWMHYGDHIRVFGACPYPDTATGDLFLADLTIHCISSECVYCESPLEFTNVGLYDDSGEDVSVVGVDGTVTCGTPPPACDRCLGDCYNAAGTRIASDVPCYDCIGVGTGVLWENYLCPAGTGGCTCPRMPHEVCPECCDGIDNDGVNGTDWPADPQCGCCIDPDETDGTIPCPDPCVPELPTLALAGIGILGIALLARKRD